MKKRNGIPTEIYYREKSSSRSNECLVENYISKRKNLLILGDRDSGKSRNISKIFRKAKGLWSKKIVLKFDALNPIGEWSEKKEVIKWCEKEKKEDWRKLKQFEKTHRLVAFCKEKKPVIFLEDLDRLSGRKLQVIKTIIEGRIIFATCLSESRVPATLRRKFEFNTQKVFLKSEVAFDATNYLIVGLVLIFVLMGMPEIAMITGLLSMIAKNRLSSKNNE